MQPADDLLKHGFEELKIPYSEKQVKQFLAYLAELKKWNKAYNLTALRTDAEIVSKHFLDSILFARVLPADVATVADVGSGAGFPGIPLKIMKPHLMISLIEPTQKKVLFLKHVSNKLGLQGLEVIDRRIEDVEGLKVDAAVTRALFSVKDFIRKTERIINNNGVLILSKGPKVGEELKGLEAGKVSVTDIKLPFDKIVRHLVVVKV